MSSETTSDTRSISKPFDKITWRCKNIVQLNITFSVPDESIIGSRKHGIMKYVWSFIKKESGLSRSVIFDHLVSLGKEVYYSEMEEFSRYINVEKCQIEMGIGYEDEGGVAIKY